MNALRGCIVLGWCATIARIHAKIIDIGYNKFIKASEEMFDKKVGRYKPFNKKFPRQFCHRAPSASLTRNLMWVLEYLNLIDGNRHQRLRHCFEFRTDHAPTPVSHRSRAKICIFSDVTLS